MLKGIADNWEDLAEAPHGAAFAHGEDSGPPSHDGDGKYGREEYNQVKLGVLRYRHRVRSGHAIMGPIAGLTVVRRGVLVEVEPRTTRLRGRSGGDSGDGVSDGSGRDTDCLGDSDGWQDDRRFEH